MLPFGIVGKDVTSWSYIFREVDLDRRQLRQNASGLLTFEMAFSELGLDDLRKECTDAGEWLHCDCRKFFTVEQRARQELMNLALRNFQTWESVESAYSKLQALSTQSGWI